MYTGPLSRLGTDATRKFKDGVSLLCEAYVYALDTRRSRWDFAIDARTLHATGLTVNDLRWLVYRGLIDHACDVLAAKNGRTERQGDHVLCFTEETVFIITEEGLLFADQLIGTHRSAQEGVVRSLIPDAGDLPQLTLPSWNAERRELHFRGMVVKRFKWQAANQELVLAVFEEENWPPRIDDPLPQSADLEPKRRLSDTIRCLNRKQSNRLIRFSGDGTGEGVIWDGVEARFDGNGAR